MAKKLMDLTDEEFADLINRKRGNSSKDNKEIPDVSSMIPGINLFKTTVKETYDFTSKVLTGSATALDAFNGASEVAKTFPVFGKLAGVLQDFGTGVFNVNDTVNKLNASGINYRNDLGLFYEQAMNSRMGLEGWTRMLANSSEDLARMGMTAGQGAIHFGQLSEMMMKDNDAMRLRIANGKEADEEMNNALKLMMSGRLKVDMNNTQSMEQASKAAINLATEIDSVAKLTGKNKEQLQRDLKAQMEKEEVQVKLLRMSQEQQETYITMMAGLRKAPQNIQDLFSEMTVTRGNIKSAAGRATFSAMGTENAVELRRIAVEMQTATGTQLVQLQKDRDALIERVNERMRGDPNFANMVTYSNTAVGEAARTMIRTASTLQADVAYMNDAIAAKAAGKSVDEYRADLKRTAAANEREGRGPDGKTSPGAIIGQTINTLDAHTKTLSAAVGKSFRELGDGIGQNKDMFKKLNEEMALFKNLKPEDVSKFVADAINSMKAPNTANPANTEGVPGYDPRTGRWNTSRVQTPEGANVATEQGALRTQNRQQATNTATSSQSSGTTVAGQTSEGTLMSDLKELFTTLNNRLSDVVTHTSTTVERLEAQTRAISSLNGNRLAH